MWEELNVPARKLRLGLAVHTHGGELGDALGHGHELQHPTEWFALKRAVEAGDNHHLARVGHLTGRAKDDKYFVLKQLGKASVGLYALGPKL